MKQSIGFTTAREGRGERENEETGRLNVGNLKG